MSRDIRNQMYNCPKNAQKLNLTKLSINEVQKIFINENLTFLCKRLFWKTKQKRKQNGFKFYWIVNGNIYAKTSESTKVILVNNDQDLELIK